MQADVRAVLAGLTLTLTLTLTQTQTLTQTLTLFITGMSSDSIFVTA